MDKIKKLLEKYYSGDILPNEYEELLSIMREVKDLPPELEDERMILLAIDSIEPEIPVKMKYKLSDAIDKRYKYSKRMSRIFYYGIAASFIICISVAIFHLLNKDVSDTKYIAESVEEDKLMSNTFSKIERIAEYEERANTEEMIISSELNEMLTIQEVHPNELDKAVQIVDESLIQLLSAIKVAQENISESLENIHTSNLTETNS